MAQHDPRAANMHRGLHEFADIGPRQSVELECKLTDSGVVSPRNMSRLAAWQQRFLMQFCVRNSDNSRPVGLILFRILAEGSDGVRMKTTLAVTGFLAVLAAVATAQSPVVRPQTVAVSQPSQPVPPPQPPSPQLAAPKLDAVLSQIQKATLSMNSNLAKLRIEKWRTDPEQKAQLQKMANSLQRNITSAVPGLVSDVQSSRGSVSSAFKLYHNMNVVYEYLNSLTDAAGSLGKREEYEPLAEDAAALDSAREGLSNYIEEAAVTLETPPAPSPNAVSTADAVAVGGGRKIIVEEVSGPVPKSTKKKTSATAAKPAPAKSAATAATKPAQRSAAAPTPAPK